MKFQFYDDIYEIRYVKGKYLNNGNLYLGIQNMNEEGEWDSFCDITLNFSEKCPDNCGFLKISDLSKEVYMLIHPYIKATGRVMENGYVKYPEVCFSQELLNQAVELE